MEILELNRTIAKKFKNSLDGLQFWRGQKKGSVNLKINQQKAFDSPKKELELQRPVGQYRVVQVHVIRIPEREEREIQV